MVPYLEDDMVTDGAPDRRWRSVGPVVWCQEKDFMDVARVGGALMMDENTYVSKYHLCF
jgi:hypothetical protein